MDLKKKIYIHLRTEVELFAIGYIFNGIIHLYI